MFSLLMEVLVYLGFGTILAYILLWIVGFTLKSEEFNARKNRLRTILAPFLGVGLWFFFSNLGPSQQATVEMIQKWYPNAQNIQVNAVTESKVETDTYKAYVSFDFGANPCHAEVTIRKGNERGYYNYSNKGYSCN